MTNEEALRLYNEVSGVVGYAPIPETIKCDIRRLYKHFVGEPLKRCNCPDMYNDALLLITLKIKKMATNEQKYRLKRGVVIQLSGTNEVYTRDNLTDEVAREYLAKFPKKAKLFDVIPEEPTEEPTEEKAEETADEPTEEKAEEKTKTKKRKK